jgi:hypothetical protein
MRGRSRTTAQINTGFPPASSRNILDLAFFTFQFSFFIPARTPRQSANLSSVLE